MLFQCMTTIPSWEALVEGGLRKACRVLFKIFSKSSSPDTAAAAPAGSTLAVPPDAAAIALSTRLDIMLGIHQTNMGNWYQKNVVY